jgi:hypothetical protein
LPPSTVSNRYRAHRLESSGAMLCATSRVGAACHATSLLHWSYGSAGPVDSKPPAQVRKHGSRLASAHLDARSCHARIQTCSVRPPRHPKRIFLTKRTADERRRAAGEGFRLCRRGRVVCCMLERRPAGLLAHTVAVVDCARESDAQTDVIHALPRLPPPRLLVGLRRAASIAHSVGIIRRHAPEPCSGHAIHPWCR